jgi:hypothetical protein
VLTAPKRVGVHGPSVLNCRPIAAGTASNRRTGLPTQSPWQRGSRCTLSPTLRRPPRTPIESARLAEPGLR